MKIRTLLVDDEPLARSRLRDLLSEHGDIDIIAECGTAAQARAAIGQQAPDLVLLDVQMPRMTGLKLVHLLGEAALPLVVFVTAHESFAVEAFDTRAVDYVLKPVRSERLARSLSRVREQLAAIRGAPDSTTDSGIRPESPVPAAPGPGPGPGQGPGLSPEPATTRRITRLMARTNDRIVFISHEQIDWIESAGNYVIVHAAVGRHIIRETMSTLEDGLPAGDFVRLNRSLLVRVDRILELRANGQGGFHAVLRDGRKVSVTVGLRELEQRLRFGG